VLAATSDAALTSIYAGVQEGDDDRMVLVTINESTGPTTAELFVTHSVDFTRGTTFRITSAKPGLVPGPELQATGRNVFHLEMPPMSVTTIVLSR